MEGVKGDMEKYDSLATAIIRNMGGAGNVNKVIHCVTRLRFYLKDPSMANTGALMKLDKVAGAVYNEPLRQYQVVIGPRVADVYDVVVDQLGDGVTDPEETHEATLLGVEPIEPHRSLLQRLFRK